MTISELYKCIFETKDMIAAAKRQGFYQALPSLYNHKARLENQLQILQPKKS